MKSMLNRYGQLNQMKQRAILIGISCLTLLMPMAFAEQQTAAGAIQNEAAFEVKKLPPANLAFESYRKNIDDLFFIALTSGESSEFGINSVIVSLNDKVKNNPKDQESLAFLGHIYRLLGQPHEANRFYQKALALGADNFHLHSFSAMMLFQTDRFEKAIEELNKSLELNPKDPAIWLAHARANLRLRRDDQAIKSYEQALLLDPKNEEAYLALDFLYLRLQRYDDAMRVLQNWLGVDSGNKMAKYHLGVVFLQKKEIKKALELWEDLYYRGVREPQFLFNLSVVYLESGDSKKSQNIVEHLQFFYPRNMDLIFLMAESYRQMNRLSDAVRKYKEVIAEEPDYMSAYIGLAQTFDDMGDKKQSQEILKKTADRFSNQKPPAQN